MAIKKTVYDVIVVGSGIAGLSFSLKMAKGGRRVCLITKKNRAESNTNYAQGGIASVTSKTDDMDLHVADTLESGAGLCDETVVRRVISEAPKCIAELIELGVAFTQLKDGQFSLHKEGGHSKRRILHVKDLTGAAIEGALLHAIAKSPLIDIYEHFFAIDIITQAKIGSEEKQLPPGEDKVLGMYVLDVKHRRVRTLLSPVVMLATGGVGQLYEYTTNPSIATGDGIAMGYRAGAQVCNLEFIQFHPTALYTHNRDRFLISEAVRGEGAILRNSKGVAFMKRYHKGKELAPRDIVARAIDSEMKKLGTRHVWLDITAHSKKELRDRFPHIYQGCKQYGVNMAKDFIPVVPACHYICGGVRTNINAETNIAGLYACGEVACTGLHGSNRLASNSLLEACVFADSGSTAALAYLDTCQHEKHDVPRWRDGNVKDSDERVVLAHNWDELRRLMWDYVGIVRTDKRLQRAQHRVYNLTQEINEYYWNFKVEPRLLALRNLVQVAELIIECALQRKESRGLHCSLDYKKKERVARDSVVFKAQDPFGSGARYSYDCSN